MEELLKVLIIGSGGREHAFARKVNESLLVDKIFLAPGNGGTETEFTNLSIEASHFEQLRDAILSLKIKLVIVGPEQPLVDGIIDYFQNQEDPWLKEVVFVGPDKACAALEGSKDFSKQIMKEAGIPTAAAKVFFASDWVELETYISNHPLPVVIKADGLAAGKGVAVCSSHQEALDFSRSVLKDQVFGEANQSLLVEEFLEGIEVSMFTLSDGVHYQLLPEAKDYKRIFDQDKGPNTGGMGSVSPVWFVDEVFVEKVKSRIINPLFNTLNSKGLSYKGFLFIGIMKVGNDPFVIEFNVRMGDPETQTVLARIHGDLVPALMSISHQNLDQFPLTFDKEAATTIVLCAENYPDTPIKGDEIVLSEQVEGHIFHAGTKRKEEKIWSNGGRVISCTATGYNLKTASERAYRLVKNVKFRGMQYRTDIGLDVMAS